MCCQLLVYKCFGTILRWQCVWSLKWQPLQAKTTVHSCVFISKCHSVGWVFAFQFKESETLVVSPHLCVALVPLWKCHGISPLPIYSIVSIESHCFYMWLPPPQFGAALHIPQLLPSVPSILLQHLLLLLATKVLLDSFHVHNLLCDCFRHQLCIH